MKIKSNAQIDSNDILVECFKVNPAYCGFTCKSPNIHIGTGAGYGKVVICSDDNCVRPMLHASVTIVDCLAVVQLSKRDVVNDPKHFRKVDLVLNVSTPILFVETCKKLSQMFEMILGTNHALIEAVKVNCDESIQIHLDHQLEILERRLNEE